MYKNLGTLKDWQGILPIVSVPFLSNEQIDIEGYRNTLKYIDGTDAFGAVLFGIASEFYKLDDTEKQLLATEFLACKMSKKKIISVTEHSTFNALKRAERYQDMGADGLMLLPPFFLGPDKEHIIDHIQTVLSKVSIPVLLQIAQNETGLSFSPEELLALHKQFPHCMFKIEGSPPDYKLIESLVNSSDDIRIFNGYAGIYMPGMLKAGCCGIMPGCSFIELYTWIYQLYEQGNLTQMEEIHESLMKFISRWMNHCEYIIKVEKNILEKRCILKTDCCRKPTYDLDASDHTDIEEFFRSFEQFLKYHC